MLGVCEEHTCFADHSIADGCDFKRLTFAGSIQFVVRASRYTSVFLFAPPFEIRISGHLAPLRCKEKITHLIKLFKRIKVAF